MKLCKGSAVLNTLCYALFGVIFMGSAVLVGFLAGNMYEISLSGPSVDASVDVEAMEIEDGESAPARLLMIDPGHGGEDGGASSESGLVEKELNMLVSDDIAHLCLLFGLPYELTRESDVLLYDLYDELEDYTGKKKSLDLKNRLRLTEESGATMFLGIHMNKFPDSQYSGLQVYYSPNDPDSASVAAELQTFVAAHLQQENTRETKRASSSIFLLNRLEIPAILVECGFLSNIDESAKLGDSAYRSTLACTIFAPIAEYFVRSAG